MLNKKDFTDIITILNKNNIMYYIFGGVALDAIRGRFTREHSDLDVFIFKNKWDEFMSTKEFKNCKLTQFGNMNFLDFNESKIGIILIFEEDNQIIVKGNKNVEKYPTEIFSELNIGDIDGLKLNLAPSQVLAYESKFSKFDEDKNLGKSLKNTEDENFNIKDKNA